MQSSFKNIYAFINGIASEVSILLLALGFGYTTDSLANALISYYLILLFRFAYRIVRKKEFWKLNVSRTIRIESDKIPFHYFAFCLLLAVPIVHIPDDNLDIETKVVWYFGAVVFYRLVMQMLLVTGCSERRTVVYLNWFIIGALLLMVPLWFLGFYN